MAIRGDEIVTPTTLTYIPSREMWLCFNFYRHVFSHSIAAVL